MQTIYFRANGNLSIGLGHLFRLKGIAERLNKSIHSILITDQTEGIDLSFIYNSFGEVIQVTSQEEEVTFFKECSSFNKVIVVDRYDYSIAYQKEIKELGFTLIYIDDLVEGHHYADVIINQLPVFQESDYQKEEYTRVYTGLDYLLLRPEIIAKIHATKVFDTQKKKTVLVALGGTDASNLLPTIATLLLQNDIEKITILSSKNTPSLKEIPLDAKISIVHNLNVNELISEVEKHQFVITSASTLALECLCIGANLLIVAIAENQLHIGQYFLDNKLSLYINNTQHQEQFVEQFQLKIKELFVKEFGDNQINHLKTIRSENLTKVIEREVWIKNVKIRNALTTDVKQYFEWSNDPLVRQNSFHSNEIPWENHVKWFNSKIKDETSFLYFFETIDHQKPVGQIRIEQNEEEAIIGISVDKSFRNKKLTDQIISKATQEYFSTNDIPITAYIKKDNIASYRVFEKAGFEYWKETEVNNNLCDVLKLKKK